MAQPIRWDNIHGISLADASRPLEAAARGIDIGLGRIQDTLASQRAVDDSNVAQLKINNTNAFLDAISRYKTPEEIRAAQASGAIDQLRSQYGNQIDHNVARAAADQRVASLQAKAQQDIAYQGVMRNEATAPHVDKLRASILAGDKAAEGEARAALAQAGYRDFAVQDAFADARGQELVGRERAGITFGNQQTKFKDDLLTNAAQRTHMVNQDATSALNAQTNARAVDFNIQNTRDQAEAARQAGKAAAAKSALREAGNMYAEGKYDGSQAPQLLEEMTKAGIGDTPYERQAVIDRLNKLAQKGVEIVGPDGKTKTRVPISMSAARAAILGSKDQVFNSWNQGWANTAEDSLKSIMSSTFTDAQGNLHSRAADDLGAFNQTLRNAMENAPGIRPMNAPKPKQPR